MRCIIFSLVSLCMVCSAVAQPNLIPGHAHNDYAVNQPLTDALSHGFLSVEADVHRVGNELYVSHDAPDTAHTLTLQQAYLAPLAARVAQHGGQVYPGYEGPFYLMIDIKTDSVATWQLLKQQLQRYRSMLATPDHTGPVTVFISGNRAMQQILHEPLAAVDGRPQDLGRGYSSAQMPVISQAFGAVVAWDGQGNMPEDAYRTIRMLANKAHAEGKKLRLWAIPDRPAVWQSLLEAGVDLINTDRLAAFADFMQQHARK